MHRTNVTIRNDQRDHLRRLTTERGTSMAEEIRLAIDCWAVLPPGIRATVETRVEEAKAEHMIKQRLEDADAFDSKSHADRVEGVLEQKILDEAKFDGGQITLPPKRA